MISYLQFASIGTEDDISMLFAYLDPQPGGALEPESAALVLFELHQSGVEELFARDHRSPDKPDEARGQWSSHAPASLSKSTFPPQIANVLAEIPGLSGTYQDDAGRLRDARVDP